MAKKYGLPTFPVSSGMRLRKRDHDEFEWLLEHGFFQSDVYQYQKILKDGSGHYRLLKNEESDARLDQEIASSTALEPLLQEHAIDLASWSWFECDMDEQCCQGRSR